MRYPASEKLEIIRTVEASHLPTRQTLKMLGIPGSTYDVWYARWSDGGLDGLADRSPRPASVWNRIPDAVRDDVVDLALEHEDLTPRELAVKYTDEKRYPRHCHADQWRSQWLDLGLIRVSQSRRRGSDHGPGPCGDLCG